MDSAITFGEFPRYHDIIGGGDNSIPTIERGTPYHTPERTRVWRFVQRLKEDMQASKQLFSTNWDYYYSLFVGRQWVVPSKKGVLREAKLPSWRAQLTVNHILPVIDLDVATTFDNDPRPYLSATTPEQQSFVAINQAGLDQVWAAENIRDKLELAYQDCKIYGTSIIKYYWDPDADEGKGAIKSYPVAIENFLVDRAAISLHDGEYTSILELSQMLDVVDGGGQDTFGGPRDARAQLLRREAVIAPDDADDGDVDVRQNVRRHGQQHVRRGQHDHQRHDDERVGALQRYADNPHAAISTIFISPGAQRQAGAKPTRMIGL